MNKIIVFFYVFLLDFVKSEMNFEVKFEVQHFENNITIREVYYSDIYNDDVQYFENIHNRAYDKHNDVWSTSVFPQRNISIHISTEGQFECIIMLNGYSAEYIRRNIHKKQIFDLYDCFKHLYPNMNLYYYPGSDSRYLLPPQINQFLERFYLYTQFEKINQKLQKYQINIDDLF